jgi:anti-sigma factor RsiW
MAVPEACQQSEQVTGLMSLALDGLLEEKRQKRLQEHLAVCPACQMEWSAMQRVSALFEQSEVIGPPLGFSVRVERRLAEKAKRRNRMFGGMAVLTGSLSLAGLTAVTVVGIVLGLLAWNYGLPAILVIGVSVMVLVGVWAWLVGRQARNHHRNGYV